MTTISQEKTFRLNPNWGGSPAPSRSQGRRGRPRDASRSCGADTWGEGKPPPHSVRLCRPPRPTWAQQAPLLSTSPPPRRPRFSPGARPERCICSLYSVPGTSPAASAPRPPPSSGRSSWQGRDQNSKDLLHWLGGKARSHQCHHLLAERKGGVEVSLSAEAGSR